MLRDGTSFENDVHSFIESLACDKVQRTIKWPGTDLLAGGATQLSGSLTTSNVDVLKSVGSLFGWLQPQYPEDLALYEGSNPVLSSVAHERLGWIVLEAFPDSIQNRIQFEEREASRHRSQRGHRHDGSSG